MIGSLAAEWLLTALFAAAVPAATLPRKRTLPLGGLAQTTDWPAVAFCPVMCAALIAMIWWPEPSPAEWLQAAVFGCAAIWFGVVAAVRVGQSRRAAMAGLHYGLMAGSMIWMLAAITAPTMTSPAAPGRGAMPGMSHAAMSTPVFVIGVLLAAYFGLAAVPRLLPAVGSRPGVSRIAAAGQAAMSAGMAAMMIVML